MIALVAHGLAALGARAALGRRHPLTRTAEAAWSVNAARVWLDPHTSTWAGWAASVALLAFLPSLALGSSLATVGIRGRSVFVASTLGVVALPWLLTSPEPGDTYRCLHGAALTCSAVVLVLGSMRARWGLALGVGALLFAADFVGLFVTEQAYPTIAAVFYCVIAALLAIAAVARRIPSVT